LTIFVVVALLIKPKQKYEKNLNKNTGLAINCIDFVVVRTKKNKKSSFLFRMGLGYFIYFTSAMN
jgi:hypothetical protein